MKKVPPIVVPKKKPPLEKSSEKRLKEKVALIGGTCFKFKSPNNRGVSDQIVLYNSQVVFVEMKRVGITKLSPLQKIFKNKVEQHGCVFVLVSGHDGVDSFVYDLENDLGLSQIYY